MYHYMTQEVTCFMWQIYLATFVWMIVGMTFVWALLKSSRQKARARTAYFGGRVESFDVAAKFPPGKE